MPERSLRRRSFSTCRFIALSLDISDVGEDPPVYPAVASCSTNITDEGDHINFIHLARVWVYRSSRTSLPVGIQCYWSPCLCDDGIIYLKSGQMVGGSGMDVELRWKSFLIGLAWDTVNDADFSIYLGPLSMTWSVEHGLPAVIGHERCVG